jgi:Tfp pilus assembly protein PilV
MIARRKRRQGGFTMIEVMVAVLLTAIAVIGIVGLYRVQTRSSAYSRRATEAIILAGDKMEVLRATLVPTSSVADEVLDATGAIVVGGPYTRRWFVVTGTTQYELRVDVLWDDDGTPRTTTLRSFRRL